MGSMDWLTTTIGILYFGAVECNPFLAGLTQTNLSGFTALKLAVTVAVGFMFYRAEKIFSKVQDINSRSFKFVRYVLEAAYVGSIVVLFVAVLNNMIIVIKVILTTLSAS